MAKNSVPRSTKPRNDITAELVRSILSYDPRIGEIRWKLNRRPRAYISRIAGCLRSDGYRIINIDGKSYLAHRLAYLIMVGEWPPHQIDHQTGYRGSLRWKDIRPASHSQNQWNKSVSRNNKTGFKGVYRRKDCNRWCAMINANGKCIYLGLFETPEGAAKAYQSAATELHGEFARAN